MNKPAMDKPEVSGRQGRRVLAPGRDRSDSTLQQAVEEFQVWTLNVGANNTASLKCDDRNGNVVFSKNIAFTDFPLDEIKLWFANDVIYLPSEH